MHHLKAHGLRENKAFVWYILAILALQLLIPAAAFAQTTQAPASGAVLVADLNIQNAKIAAQNGNIVTIVFDLVNGKGALSGMRLGLVLGRQSGTALQTFDEKTFDAPISLAAGQTLHEQLTYAAPTALSGSYTLYIVARNEGGVPVGNAIAGKVALKDTGGIFIDPSSCYLSAGAGAKHYALHPGVDIAPAENLSVTCQAQNTGGAVSVTSAIETRANSTLGPSVPTPKPAQQSISFAANETRSISFALPHSSTAGIYSALFSLQGSVSSSNTLDAQYVIQGSSASIWNFALDKTSYAAGENAAATFIWNGAGDAQLHLRSGTTSPAATTYAISLATAGGSACGSATGALAGSIMHVSVPITGACDTYKATLTLYDHGGEKLAAQSIDLTHSKAHPSFFAAPETIALLLGAVFLLCVIYLLMRRKHVPTIVVRALIPFAIVAFSFLPHSHAYAGSWCMYINNNQDPNVLTSIECYNVNDPSASAFQPGQSIPLTTTVSYDFPTATDVNGAAVFLPAGQAVGPNSGFRGFAYGGSSGGPFSFSIPAPSSAGNYTLWVSYWPTDASGVTVGNPPSLSINYLGCNWYNGNFDTPLAGTIVWTCPTFFGHYVVPVVPIGPITVAATTPPNTGPGPQPQATPPTVSCTATNNADGTITWNASASGGSGGYSYSWSDTAGHSFPTYTDPTFGPFTYADGFVSASVFATDSNGISSQPGSCSTTVSNPSLNVFCSPTINGDGSVTWSASVSGGSGTYTYSWADAPNGRTFPSGFDNFWGPLTYDAPVAYATVFAVDTARPNDPPGRGDCSVSLPQNQPPVQQPNPPTPAPTCQIQATPSSWTAGSQSSITLSWTSTNATGATLTQPSGTYNALTSDPANTISDLPSVGSFTYVLTVTGPGGSASCYAPVTVTAAPQPPGPPTGFTASCNAGQGTLSWQSAFGATDYEPIIYVPLGDSCPSGWTNGGSSQANQDTECYIPSYSGASISATLIPGHSYAAYVYAHNSAGFSASAAGPQYFQCPVTCPDGSSPQNGICTDEIGCHIDASPPSVTSGDSTTLTWTTGCSAAWGCSRFGLPPTPTNVKLENTQSSGSVSVQANDSKVVRPNFNNSSFITYTLSGNYMVGIAPLSWRVDTFSCQTTITPQQGAVCPGGVSAPGGNIANCSLSCVPTHTVGSCINNNTVAHNDSEDASNNSCGVTDQPCIYAAQGYGCFVDQTTHVAQCAVPPPPQEPQFSVTPKYVHKGDSVTITWSVPSGSQPLLCTVTGTNSDQWSTTAQPGQTVTVPQSQLDPIQSETTFVLECRGAITGDSLDPQSAEVRIIPSFTEPNHG